MLETFAEILAVIVTIYGVAMALANYPQTMKIIKKRSCNDVSILTYLILFPGVLLWILYGISINNLPIIITNLLAVSSLASVIIVYYIYKK